MIATIDWLEFTVFEVSVLEIVENLLDDKIENYTTAKKGKLGYRKQIMNKNVYILSQGNENMGIHVIATGRGCRQLEERTSLILLLNKLKVLKSQVTRIDLALDDYGGDKIKIKNIISDANRGNLVSKWKTFTIIQEKEIKNQKKLGNTIYFGSRKSDIMLRIYDKGLEQGILGSKWTRLELEIKKEKAKVLQEIIAEDIGFYISRILNQYIRFLEKRSDKNKSRWPTAIYWQEILNTTEKLKLSRVKEEKTIDDVKFWIEKQIAPSLALIMLADEGDYGFLDYQIEQGFKRLKDKHYKILEGLNV